MTIRFMQFADFAGLVGNPSGEKLLYVLAHGRVTKVAIWWNLGQQPIGVFEFEGPPTEAEFVAAFPSFALMNVKDLNA